MSVSHRTLCNIGVSQSNLSEVATRAPLVSVIINCYNGAKYVREALESVRAQSFSDWEIIFWDNQSNDDSATIFNSFCDSRFHYFLAPRHTTLGVAKKLAIEKAHGDWLGLLDCDDTWLPNKLERQVAIISEEGPQLGLVYGRMRSLVESDGRRTLLGKRALSAANDRARNVLPEGSVFSELLKDNFIPQPSALVRSSAYISAGGINPELLHSWDYDLFLRVAKTTKVRAVQDVVCRYRIHAFNLSHALADRSYAESISIVSSHLPLTEAALGLRHQQTRYATYELRRGRLPRGIKRLVRHGSVPIFVGSIRVRLQRNVCTAFRAVRARILGLGLYTK